MARGNGSTVYLIGGGPSRVANVDTQNKRSVIKMPHMPRAASATKNRSKPPKVTTRSRRTTCLPSQYSWFVAGWMPKRLTPSVEMGRTFGGHSGGGVMGEYRTARMSFQSVIIAYSPRKDLTERKQYQQALRWRASPRNRAT